MDFVVHISCFFNGNVKRDRKYCAIKALKHWSSALKSLLTSAHAWNYIIYTCDKNLKYICLFSGGLH